MLKKTPIEMMLIVLLLGMSTLTFYIQPIKSESTIIYVDDDNTAGPWDGTPEHPYQNITSGLEHAVDDDTIFVRNGTYNEHVVVSKTVSLVGENMYSTIVEGNRTGTVLRITQNNVNVTGLTIRGSGSTPNVDAGVYLENVGYCTISGNRVLENEFGISLEGSYQNTISENLVMENYYWGIHLEFSSNHNTLVENFIIENRGGINIHFGSHFNTIFQNRILNGTYGIKLNNADSNSISKNFLSHLELGLEFQADADYNIVIENNIINCGDGAELRQAHNNTFYRNTFKNPQQVVISTYGYANFWDNGSEGNYWSDHNPPDENSDKIGDIPYVIDENNQDNYPLIYPYDHVFTPDTNGDGIVDIFDVVLISIAFGSVPGDPNWNPNADITNDATVDIFDVVALANDFGKSS